MSMAFENLPLSSGRVLPRYFLAIASLTVVNFARCGWRSGARLCFVALCAAAFVSDPSVKSVSAGIHIKSTEFPPCFNSSPDS